MQDFYAKLAQAHEHKTATYHAEATEKMCIIVIM